MIRLPDYRQRESWDCGRCLFEIICKYYNKPLPLFIANLSNAAVGLSPDSLEAGFRSLGFKVLVGHWTVDLLKSVTKDGKPVATLIQLDGIGHWVAVSSVFRNRVYYQCPERGPVSDRVVEWEKIWIDYHHTGGVFDRWGICPYL
jgi:ABC-type bacteriocin/lantibiotic exporter with double-glycine peptidase domain